MSVMYVVIIMMLMLLNSTIYPLDTAAVCQAIQQHDIATVKKHLKNVSLSIDQKKALIKCARDAVYQYQHSGAYSTESKQQLFSTLCVAGIGLGGWAGVALFVGLCMGGGSWRFLMRDPAAVPLLGAFVTLFGGGIVSGYESETGRFTDKPRYIQDYIHSLSPHLPSDPELVIEVQVKSYSVPNSVSTHLHLRDDGNPRSVRPDRVRSEACRA